jgi:16S rRNA processing protein RimM
MEEIQNSYHLLGKILRTHGVKGDVVVYLDTDAPEQYKSLKLIYVQVEGQFKEFDVTKVNLKGGKDKTATIHLRGIEDMTTAELYLKCDLFIPKTSLPRLTGKKFYFHEIIGFAIHDKQLGNIGEVLRVVELPQHPIAEIIHKEKETLIPLSEYFIQKIDRANKIIQMDLPDGLLEIYQE